MNLFEAIKKRHSYRGCYLGKPVSREDLIRIVEAGISAPSGKNAQTTEFIIVDDKALINEIARIMEKENIQSAGALIACIAEKKEVYEGYSFHIEDCAAATENILLAITAMGYASVWIDGALRVKDRAKKIAHLLNIPDKKTLHILLPVGIPAEEWLQKEKKPFNQRAWFNSYGK